MASGGRRQSFRSQVADIFKCSICLEIPPDPKVLPCMHLACLDCLERTHAAGSGNDIFQRYRIRCPSCRKEHRIPDGGLSQLPTDYRAIQVGDIVNCQTPTSPKQDTIFETPFDLDLAVSSLHRFIQQDKLEAAKTLMSELSPLDRRRVVSCARHVTNQDDVTQSQDFVVTALHACILHNRPEFLCFLLDECRADPNFSGKSVDPTRIETPDPKRILKESSSKKTTATSNPDYGRGKQVLAEASGGGGRTKQAAVSEEERHTSRGVPPLWLAADRRNFDAVHILLTRGADVNMKTSWGSCALRVACFNNDVRLVRHLVKHNADTSAADTQGVTCLMTSACNNPDGRILEVLLDHNAPVNAQNKNGWTTLHFAVANDNYSGARVLLEHGANPNIGEHVVQQTALDMALDRGRRIHELLYRYNKNG